MQGYHFLDDKGTFSLKNPENYSYLYFPVAGETGLKSALTPNLLGDAKVDQNTFLLEPVSAENLHNNRGSRNFWCHVKGIGNWSATGVSAEEIAKKYTDIQDKSEVCAGFMWHTLSRESTKYQLRADITSFVTVEEGIEVMQVVINNIGKMDSILTATAAIPIYGRSADNIRDHRHVTSLLHRIETMEYGVAVTPTLSFDERGHQKNRQTYFVCGMDDKGEVPQDFYPVVEDFIGEGGNFERPEAVVLNKKGVPAHTHLQGLEAIGGLHFKEVVLKPDESVSYTILMGVTSQADEINEFVKKYRQPKAVEHAKKKVQTYWQEKVNVRYQTGEQKFDRFMRWVSFQPMLRRIYGCSFLPHHDYGRGGRGWRDLWQDCLALLMMNPDGVREMLTDNFAGVRMDGSNATIIGNGQGEFVADRNHIARVWMDHGVWPLMTTKLYIHQTGDLEILEKEVPYFKDKQICRGTKTDGAWKEEQGCWQKTVTGEQYYGSVLEHLLLQNLTAFYEVGEHNQLRLRGADWNDALDMAEERGESVAFSNAYAGNLMDLADILMVYQQKTGKEVVFLTKQMEILLGEQEGLYDSIEKKKQVIDSYMATCTHQVDGEKAAYSIDAICDSLRKKAEWMMEHIRKQEWVTDEEGNGWFNGYYDNHGRQVEGSHEGGVRMMLTGEVFSIMAGTAREKEIRAIVKSADCYLYQKECGGYRLNTDFKEVKTDLGRMFGFSYGDKENGAVFSHMAVMYGNALYKQGFAKEGYRALDALYQQSVNFKVSKIYPGIPEYFNARGRGMYHYLTGAASWYMLTVITEMFGVKGLYGDLCIAPKLLAKQFDEEQKAELELDFGTKHWKITFYNEKKVEVGCYGIDSVTLDGKEIPETFLRREQGEIVIHRRYIDELEKETRHHLAVYLGER